jgi:chemotaxis protein MotB
LNKQIKKEEKHIVSLKEELMQKENVIDAKTETVKIVNKKNDQLGKDVLAKERTIEKYNDKINALEKKMAKDLNLARAKEQELVSKVQGLGQLDKDNKGEIKALQHEANKYKKALGTVLDGTYEDVNTKEQKIADLTSQLSNTKKELAKELRLSSSKSGLLKDLERELNSKQNERSSIVESMSTKTEGLSKEIESKNNSLNILNKEKETLLLKLKQNDEGVSYEFVQLGEAMAKIQEKLQLGIDDYRLELQLSDEGIEMTVLTDKLFSSGSSDINAAGKGILFDIGNVLTSVVPENKVEILGHTDNKPIRYSAWNSNWELSTARSLSVLEYFVTERNMKPNRFAVVGCGEYFPVADNATEQGRKKNRRVDIVIKPL